MPPRKGKSEKQAIGESIREGGEPNQDPIRRMMNLMVDIFEEGINEFRRGQTKSEKITPTKEEKGNYPRKIKTRQIEEDNSGSRKNSKRKWDEGKSKQKGCQLKKKRGEFCKNCGKNHIGICLKGKNVCYNCGQEGHISPNCPKPKEKGSCFGCGALDHQVRNCPSKGKGMAGERSKPTTHVSVATVFDGKEDCCNAKEA